MAATVISKKKYDDLLNQLKLADVTVKNYSETIEAYNKKIAELNETERRDAATIIAQVREVSHWKEKAQRLQQRCEDLEIFRLRNSRKHWWEIWKPVYPY